MVRRGPWKIPREILGVHLDSVFSRRCFEIVDPNSSLGNEARTGRSVQSPFLYLTILDRYMVHVVADSATVNEPHLVWPTADRRIESRFDCDLISAVVALQAFGHHGFHLSGEQFC